ncbi:predicted protein [Streptomyces filamentosus NRRL 15998]|uniref:Predicted protein n=1 Tax=Streptomyces filamentosus NRRL 15998 TaxID=457431 RepID=D6AJ49_STRFL|nr:predicted protein [Streptomyces filamentosus NRRL 15998]
MGESERERGRPRGASAPTSAADPRGDTPRATPPRTAGQQFGAFQRGRRPQGNAAANAEQPDAGTVPPPPPSSAP